MLEWLTHVEYLRGEYPVLLTVFVLVLGSMIGSFLNVCILRIPEGKSIVHPPSTCACGAKIPFYRNLPVISWLLLRGRAACCGARLSWQYPVVEAVTAIVFALIWSQTGWSIPEVIAGWFLFSFLLVGTWIDWDYLILPDRITFGLVFSGVLLAFLFPSLHPTALSSGVTSGIWYLDGVRSAGMALFGVLIGSGVVLWTGLMGELLLKKEAVGFGDVKLVGGIGAYAGWQGGVFSLFGGAILGVFCILIFFPFWSWWKRKYPGRPLVGRKMRVEDYPEESAEDVGLGTGNMIPFGPMIALGGLIYFFFLRGPFDEYLREIGRLLYS